MINNVVLIGRLTRDPELRYTGNGTAVANFTIAADRPFTNADGEHDTDFISCVIWRKQAENLANMAHKGSLIGVVGRIQTRNYENNSGQRVYVTEVVADSFQMLESKRQSQQNNQQGNYQQSQRPQAVDPFGSSSEHVDVDPNALPF